MIDYDNTFPAGRRFICAKRFSKKKEAKAIKP